MMISTQFLTIDQFLFIGDRPSSLSGAILHNGWINPSMLDKLAESNKAPFIISVSSMAVSILCLLATIIVLIGSSRLEGRYAEQSSQNALQGQQIMTLEAYVNSLRMIMTKAGVESPEPPKLDYVPKRQVNEN